MNNLSRIDMMLRFMGGLKSPLRCNLLFVSFLNFFVSTTRASGRMILLLDDLNTVGSTMWRTDSAENLCENTMYRGS